MPLIGSMICFAVKSLARAVPSGRIHPQPAAEIADPTLPVACRQISHFQVQPLHRTFVDFLLTPGWQYGFDGPQYSEGEFPILDERPSGNPASA